MRLQASLLLAFCLQTLAGCTTTTLGTQQKSPPAPTECPQRAARSSALHPQDKPKDIQRLLVALHFDDQVQTIMATYVATLRAQSPDLPEEFFKIFQDGFSREFIRQLAIPIYDRHLTHEEIVALAEFYESPAGQSATLKIPLIATESMKGGAEWGRLFVERALSQWRAQHTSSR
jgi:hypothetical protein